MYTNSTCNIFSEGKGQLSSCLSRLLVVRQPLLSHSLHSSFSSLSCLYPHLSLISLPLEQPIASKDPPPPRSLSFDLSLAHSSQKPHNTYNPHQAPTNIDALSFTSHRTDLANSSPFVILLSLIPLFIAYHLAPM